MQKLKAQPSIKFIGLAPAPARVLSKLLTVLALTAAASTAQADFSLQATTQAESFLSHWQGYDNQTYSLKLDPRLETSHWSAQGELRISTQSHSEILGNVEHLLYRVNENVELGRDRPSPSFIRLGSMHDRLNEKICATPLDCVRGGPIGLHLNASIFRLSVSLANPPDVYPSPELDNSGHLQSHDRWASPPVEEVELGEGSAPVRFSKKLGEGLGTFFRPGVRLTTHLDSELGDFRIINSLEPSRSSSAAADNYLQFTRDSNGNLQPQAQSDVTLNFPYEQIHSLQQESMMGSELLWQNELTFARRDSANRYSGLSRLTLANLAWLRPSAGIGALANLDQPGVTDPFIEAGLSIRPSHRWKAEILAYKFWAKGRSALHLNPTFEWSFDRRSEVYIGADLVRADAAAPWYGDMRGNDRVYMGYRYDFRSL